MPLSPGTRLGSFDVVSPLGAGGMGDVYLARDRTLGREVAIKVLRAEQARDAGWLARFRREATLLASLNHPNIATVHELGDADSQAFLVMELVPGDTLAERLARGPVPLGEALRIGADIAAALAAAHERGVIHRDLKPANIKITPDGRVKVLDFGLAKSLDDRAEDAGATRTGTTTQPGSVMGTPAYMSPEQARGQAVDARGDLWAFGCVLFEMLTGERPFHGDTVTDTVVSVMTREPDWSKLPAVLPEPARSVLRRCLYKDQRQRLRDAADAALLIEDARTAAPVSASSTVGATTPVAAGRSWRRVAAIAALIAVAAIAGVIGGRWLFATPADPSPVVRFSIQVPAGDRLLTGCPSFALSPDGTRLAFIAVHDNRSQIYLREINGFDAVPIPGTEGVADSLTFSPDGRWLGFLTGTEFKKVAIGGGAPVTLLSSKGCGADWGPGDRIALGMLGRLIVMSAVDGSIIGQIAADSSKGEIGLAVSEFLPDGGIMFAVSSNRGTDLVAQHLGASDRTTIATNAGSAHLLLDGRLAFAQAGAVLVAPFDQSRRKVTGPPVKVFDGVVQAPESVIAVARSTGAIAYMPGGVIASGGRTLVRVDRGGAEQPLAVEPGAYGGLRVSPDGKQLAMGRGGRPTPQIWVFDFTRGTFTPVTNEHDSRLPIWMPDSARLTYMTIAGPDSSLVTRAADKSGGEELVLRAPAGAVVVLPEAWSPDGSWLAYTVIDQASKSTIHLFGRDAARPPPAWPPAAWSESSPRFSRDGRAVAYVSDESSRNEVYVRQLAGAGSRIPIAAGTNPVWAPNGRELFFRSGSKMMAVDVVTDPALHAGVPHQLFEGTFAPVFDVMPDGQHFVMMKPDGPPPAITRLNVVLRWTDELQKIAR